MPGCTGRKDGHGRLAPAATFLPSAGSAIWARVISTRSASPLATSSSARATSTTEPCATRATPFGRAVAHDRRRLAVETRLDMRVGPGGGGPERGAAHGTEVVEPRSVQGGHEGLRAVAGTIPAHAASSSHRQPETDDAVAEVRSTASRVTRDHPAQELGRGPRRARRSRKLVSREQNWRRRLYWPAFSSTPSQPASTAACGRDAESGDQGLDLLGLHGFGDFAGLRVGHRGGPEQDTLVIGARSLSTRVAERCDHQGALLVAGIRDAPTSPRPPAMRAVPARKASPSRRPTPPRRRSRPHLPTHGPGSTRRGVPRVLGALRGWSRAGRTRDESEPPGDPGEPGRKGRSKPGFAESRPRRFGPQSLSRSQAPHP